VRSLFGFFAQKLSGLRFRLLLLLLLVCAPLLALMLHTAGEDRRRAMASWQKRAEEMSQVAQREEQEMVSATHQLLLAIAESSAVHSMNPRRCKKFLVDELGSYPRYSNLAVLKTNGELIASALPLSVSKISPTERFFRQTLQTRGFAAGEFPTRWASDKPTIAFGFPVLDHSTRILGVVFGELDRPWLGRSGFDLSLQLPQGATWTEVDHQGRMLVRYPGKDTRFGDIIPEQSLLLPVLSQASGHVEQSDPKGVPYVYAYKSRPSQLAASSVVSILGIPRQVLFAEADNLLRRNLTWLAIAVGVALMLGWGGSKVLVLRPVKALVRSTARLAAGDLTVRTGLPYSRDELGQLTLAFDQMVQALEQRDLERQRASQKLQVLSHRLVEVQESERRHIARELHDEIGQSLTAAEINLQAALQLPGNPALERRLEQSIKAVEHVLEQVHDLSLSLRPSMLDDLGLEPTLRSYTHRQAELTGIDAEFKSAALENRLDPIIETECFRIAQEALTNVVRHAQARSVRVELSRNDGRLHLTVRDDGIGFNVSALREEAVRGASLGLLSMEERAALAGGGLQFKSVPGQGTEVQAWFPLKWRNTIETEKADE
jgi:signal transduction histidine kinase